LIYGLSLLMNLGCWVHEMEYVSVEGKEPTIISVIKLISLSPKKEIIH